MENYILCGEIGSTPARVSFKARFKQSIAYVGIHRYDSKLLDYATTNVQSLHSMQHENIIRFIEWSQSPNHIWIITELVNGGTLADIMDEDGPMRPDTAYAFIPDIAAGLRYVHSRGIVLCELIPCKILVDCSGSLKLSEFGLCIHGDTRWRKEDVDKSLQLMHQTIERQRAVQEDTEDKREGPIARHLSLHALPSPFYMSPEVHNGAHFSSLSDLWSLGCILYELITGQCPFLGSLPGLLSSAVVDIASTGHLVTDDNHVQGLIDGLLQPDTTKRLDWNSAQLQALVVSTV